jgi:hypothetical protein
VTVVPPTLCPICGRRFYLPHACPLTVVCPLCDAPVGQCCRSASGKPLEWHALRSKQVESERRLGTVPHLPTPAPAKAPAAKRSYNEPGPRTRGAAKAGLAYRIVKTRRLPKGGMWVAVSVSVDGAESTLIGVELAESEVEANGPDEKALRRAVEAGL